MKPPDTIPQLSELLKVLSEHGVESFAIEGMQIGFKTVEDSEDEALEDVIGFRPPDPNDVGADGLNAEEQEELYGDVLDAPRRRR